MENELRMITEEDVKEIISLLVKHNVDYVVFGAVALNLHGIERQTQDIDIYLRNTESNIKNFIKAFSSMSMFEAVTEQDLLNLVEERAFEYGVIKFIGDIGMDVATSMGETTIDS